MSTRRFDLTDLPFLPPLLFKQKRPRRVAPDVPDLTQVALDTKALRQGRMKRNFTQQEAARAVGLKNRQQICDIETGLSLPRGDVLLRLLILYEMRVEEAVRLSSPGEQTPEQNSEKNLRPSFSKG